MSNQDLKFGTVAFCGVDAATMAHNGGKNEWDITPAEAQEASYVSLNTIQVSGAERGAAWFNIASIHYGVTICIAKLTVLWLYRRAFPPQRCSPFDIGIVILIVLMILFYTSTTLAKIFECTPRSKILDPSIQGSCVNVSMLFNTSGAFNTITDAIILCLPIKAVWKMKLRLKDKIVVVLVFTFGLCTPAFSLMGFIVRLQGSNNPDKTWVQPDIIMWGAAELSTGVLCVSLPELGSLLKKRNKRDQPSASTVNGNYRESTYHPHGSHGAASKGWHTNRKLNGDS
ncbi:MAG: hypothetical protein LQ340_002200 [Diploschistes diacapsis]|nr:MAG: hypothetical protein LQ340_002200 [Diploschistes diacapsis]